MLEISVINTQQITTENTPYILKQIRPNYMVAHENMTHARQGQNVIRDSNLDFRNQDVTVCRIAPDICRIAPRMLWIHALVSLTYFAK